jgi:DNA polymerase III epsilon subunit-like protein
MLTMNHNLFCALDVETTGLESGYHDLVQVAIVPLDDNLNPLVGKSPFYMNLCPNNPERADPRAMEVNGLDMDELLACPKDFQVADCLDEWFASLELPMYKKLIYLTQNAPFDIPYMKNWLGMAGFDKYFHRRGRDTMFTALAKNDEAAWKNQPIPFKYVGLKNLCEVLGVPLDNHHDALADCVATARVYKELLRME